MAADAAYQIYPRVLWCVIMSGGGVSAVSHTRDHDQWSGGPNTLQLQPPGAVPVSVWMCRLFWRWLTLLLRSYVVDIFMLKCFYRERKYFFLFIYILVIFELKTFK